MSTLPKPRKKISFDFDGVLEYSHMQVYASELIKRGFDVFIVTARYHSLYIDVVEVAENLKIPYHRLIFTDGDEKYLFFKENRDFIFHIDDDHPTCKSIKQRSDVNTVHYDWDEFWQDKCEEIISKVK